MATDRNKKSLRTFQCRDYLWEYFEQMAGELDCSVDYLVNEAMRQYAKARLQASRGGGAGGSQASLRPAAPPSRHSSSAGSIPSIRTTGSGSHPGVTAGSGSHPGATAGSGSHPGAPGSGGQAAMPPSPPTPGTPQP
ncbi:MAG: hypothetical protein ACODAG_09240, partial [Myxococcota bacterium]